MASVGDTGLTIFYWRPFILPTPLAAADDNCCAEAAPGLVIACDRLFIFVAFL